jgi:excisionase family DNA binding protein
MSVLEAGRKLGLGRRGSYAAARRGDFPVLKIGGRWRVPVVAFERWLAEAKPKAKPNDQSAASK